MQIITTNAAEIIEFVEAEAILSGTPFVFTSLARIRRGDLLVTERIAVRAERVVKAIANAVENGVSVRNWVGSNGNEHIEIHTGDSVYARFTIFA